MYHRFDLHYLLNLEEVKKEEIYNASCSFRRPDGIVDYWGQEYLLKFPLDFEICAYWANEDLKLDMGLSFKVEIACARCLKPVLLDISGQYNYIYTLRPPSLEPDHQLSKEEMSMVHMDFWPTSLDLAPQLWESIILSLPSIALCSPNCRGLCPHCGRDLNEESCSCASMEVDPRLEVLKKAMAMLGDSERGKKSHGRSKKKGLSRKGR